MLRYFKKSEDHARGADEAYGGGGELRVEDLRASGKVLDAFCEAAVECGIRKTNDFNRGDNKGVGYFRVTQRNGRLNRLAATFDVVRHQVADRPTSTRASTIHRWRGR